MLERKKAKKAKENINTHTHKPQNKTRKEDFMQFISIYLKNKNYILKRLKQDLRNSIE